MLCRGQVIENLNGEEIALERFMKKKLQKTSQTEFKTKKIIKKNCDKLYVQWNFYGNLFNSWIDKKDMVKKMIQYFPKPYELSGGNVNMQQNLI